MKILQTIAGFGAHSGGTSTCTYDLISALQKVDCDVDLLTPDCDDMMGYGEEWIKSVPNDYISPYGYSKNIRSFLKDSDYDIYHTNGMWMYCNHKTCEVARRKGKPYIITPHGMLYPEALARSRWKKLPMEILAFKRDVMEAACMHATCSREMQNIRKYGYKGPIAVIGNPVAIPDYIDEIVEKKKAAEDDSHKLRLGFLGRLHPIKQTERLLYGVAKAPQKKNIEIIIMGKGDDDYENFLRGEVSRLGLEDNVKFEGFVNGRAKYETLANLTALFVPSDMENFGMIIAEALIVHTPVMASLGTPWQSLNETESGWWVDNSPESIAKVIKHIQGKSREELLAMGARGAELIKEKFSDVAVATQMKQLYQWLADGGEKPEFVYTE